MTTIEPCSATHPTLGYPCERGTHAGPHAAYGLSWVDLPDDLPPIQHMAAVGLVGMEIQHPSGECAWCDAERWRSLIPSAVAGFHPDQVHGRYAICYVDPTDSPRPDSHRSVSP